MEKKNKSIIAIGIAIAIVVFLGGAFVGSILTQSSLYNNPVKITGDNLEFVGKQNGAYTYKVCGCQEDSTCNKSNCGETCQAGNSSTCGCSK
jgi:uncharacterized protein YneF (UPF0154 family)